MKVHNHLHTTSLLLSLFLLSRASLLHAQDCKSILAKLPNHLDDGSLFSVEVKNHIERCKQGPQEGPNSPQVFQECIRAGMSALGIGGNYVAAEKLAIMYCGSGLTDLSKQWMISVANSPYAPSLDKEIAQELTKE